MAEQEPQEIIELAINEAGKMDIPRLRTVVRQLADQPEDLENFKSDPTEYLRERIGYIPQGFHAHYAEGRDLVPAETFGGATERFAMAIRIDELRSAGICIVCTAGCCLRAVVA